MPTKPAYRVFAVCSYILGVAGMGVFCAYVLGSGSGYWPRGEPDGGVFAWLNNLGWLLAFAVQHSGMARQPFKTWWTRLIPAPLERSCYVAFSGLLLAGLSLCWQPLPGEPLWHGPPWIAAFSLAGAIGAGIYCCRYDHLKFLGLAQAWQGSPAAQGRLHITGPYRFVRHPLMLGLLVALWAQPIMPPELLLMNVGWTIYIQLGIRLEERDLIRQYGGAYETYRRKVPALIPFLRLP